MLRRQPHLDGEVVAAERQVVTATQRRVLRPHVHLQVLEEVHVLVRSEGHQHSDSARDGGVHQRLAAARNQRRFLYTEQAVMSAAATEL